MAAEKQTQLQHLVETAKQIAGRRGTPSDVRDVLRQLCTVAVGLAMQCAEYEKERQDRGARIIVPGNYHG